jgi:hypothetical protein
VGHKPAKTAWLGTPKAAEGFQGLPTTPTNSQTVKRVPSSGSTNSHQTVADGSPVPETDSTSLSKENLRSRVYTLMVQGPL